MLENADVLKYRLLYLYLFIFIPLAGQQDTISIGEIIISGRQIQSDIPGFKKSEIDSVSQEIYKHLTFSELLSECSPLFIKSYGFGGSATASFRGTGASHTQVTWNGININSPMLGQTDFSLITAGISDNIQLNFGGASLYYGSGGLGGSVNLENKPVWSEETEVRLSTGAGSFGHYNGSVRLNSGNNILQTVTRAYLTYAENNFPYRNNLIAKEPVPEKRMNNQLRHKSFLEEIYLKKGRSILSARIWYQSTSRNLPGSMLVVQSGPDEKQYDESLRSLLGYESGKGKTNFFIKGAWMVTKLDYFSKLSFVTSRNKTNTFALRGGMETRISNSTTLNVTFTDDYNIIASNNYRENISRNSASVTVSAQRKKGKRFGTSILLREILDGQSLLLPDFAAGLEFRLLPGSDHLLKAGLSRNSRIPSMNDRYWNPGGNLSLKNEYAIQYEFGYKLTRNINPSLNYDTEITCFNNHIRDMIQWQPGSYSYWIAENIGNVNASGLESVFSIKYNKNRLNARISAGYSYTRSVSVSSEETIKGNQLMYIPENQGNMSLNIVYRNVFLTWMADFTGKRYITVDNTGYLPAYFLNDIICGYRMNINKTSFDLSLKVENLFNSEYQTVAYHPQPGRSFYISLSFQLNKP